MLNYREPPMELERLTKMKNDQYLSTKIWPMLGENMHYEIIKYLNWKSIYILRAINLAGFQLCTSKVMRRRIGNYPCPKLLLDPISMGFDSTSITISMDNYILYT